MKILLFLPILLWNCISINENRTIIKLNKSENIDILYESNNNSKDKPIYIIKNNTENTYIIDPFGFRGTATLYEDNNLLNPYILGLKGYYERPSDKWCKNDLIILLPYESKKIETFNTNYSNTALYHYSKGKKYFEIIKSAHNKNTATYFGCEEYIRELESKGYKVLEDSISVKIPVFPKEFSN
ncbi:MULTISPECIES: hypothetical protein [unclassified Chryseobacterium]|uniref:hypothetical protein n=1 Tax=unclassified Chryseobacterium TaxID=2593645 RepID=UPI00300FC5C2